MSRAHARFIRLMQHVVQHARQRVPGRLVELPLEAVGHPGRTRSHLMPSVNCPRQKSL